MAGPANRVCVVQQKGGVGKTTIAINTAAALNAAGQDTLLVDLDPQGNATEDVGMPEAYEAEPPTLFDCLTDAEKRGAVTDIIREHEEMDVLPSNIDMTAVEPELTLSRRSGEQLDLLLEHVEDDYDYIIVDSPPQLGNLTDNALFACRNVLIPALAESTSKRAFELLYDHIDALQTDYEISIGEVGVAINRIDVRKKQARDMIEWIEDAYPDTPVWRIRERADIQKSLEAGESLLAYNPESDMCDVFEQVAVDVAAHFGETEVSSDV